MSTIVALNYLEVYPIQYNARKNTTLIILLPILNCHIDTNSFSIMVPVQYRYAIYALLLFDIKYLNTNQLENNTNY